MAKRWLDIILILLIGTQHLTEGARILGIFPGPSVSHHLVFQTIMKALAARGHQVTVISTDPLKVPVKNYTDVDISFMYDYVKERYNFTDYEEVTAFGAVLRFSLYVGIACTMQLGSPQIQQFLQAHPKQNTSFDLVFMELSRYQCYYGLVHHIGSPPVIGIRSVGITAATLAAVGNPNNPAYFPDYYLPYTSHMTFFERVHNTAIYIWNGILWNLLMMPTHEIAMRYYFGWEPPSVWTAENNISLVMVNNHWSQSYPLPLLPSVIQLGNIHLQEKPKPLPKDLKEFLDNAPEGVIYFSLGTNVRSETLPEEKKKAFLSTFAELPQKVLWKWEADYMPGLPPNVKLAKWLPQQDVLAHPNVKLFITQGGLQSFHEATFHAVPLIGIPFICDQRHNVRKMVDAGVGLKVEYATVNKDNLLSAIRRVLHEPRENMEKFSAISKDVPDKSLDRAIWWAEYVLRHNGARHLRSAALDLSWYQYLLLDVISVLVLGFLAVSFILYIVVKRTFKFIIDSSCIRKEKKVNKKSKGAKKTN